MTCTGPNCTRTDHMAKGLCSAHYIQQYRGLTLTPLRRWGRNRRCEAEGCDRAHHAHGLCFMHYERTTKGHPR